MEPRLPFWIGVAVLLAVGGTSLLGCTSGPTPPSTTEECTATTSCSGPVGQWQFLGLSSEHLSEVTAIAVDRCDPQTIYAGTSANFSGGTPTVLFKSSNCGQSWDTLFVGGIQGGGITDLELDPKQKGVVYALPGPALKSTDGGTTWSDMTKDVRLNTRAHDLEVHPHDPRILYLNTGTFGSGRLLKSLNGGASWVSLETDTFAPTEGEIVISPSRPQVVYFLKGTTSDVYRTDDGGETWTKTSLRDWIDEPDATNTVQSVLVDADNSNVVYAGLGVEVPFGGDTVEGPLLVRSRDGGKTWQTYATGLPKRGIAQKLVQHRVTGELFLIYTDGNQGNLYRRPPGTQRWNSFGIDYLRMQSHFYGALEVVEVDNSLYFGLEGLYRMKLPPVE
jgi:photosystem II stability/assembly factor-like uncharacterized protein